MAGPRVANHQEDPLAGEMATVDWIDLTDDSIGETGKCAHVTYPEGAVRLTYNRFTPMNRSQYITFDEILGPVLQTYVFTH